MAMPDQHVSKTVSTGVQVVKTEHGYAVVNAAGATVKLPAHVAKFFFDHGVLTS